MKESTTAVSVICQIRVWLVIGQDRRSSAKKQNITSARSAILH